MLRVTLNESLKSWPEHFAIRYTGVARDVVDLLTDCRFNTCDPDFA